MTIPALSTPDNDFTTVSRSTTRHRPPEVRPIASSLSLLAMTGVQNFTASYAASHDDALRFASPSPTSGRTKDRDDQGPHGWYSWRTPRRRGALSAERPDLANALMGLPA